MGTGVPKLGGPHFTQTPVLEASRVVYSAVVEDIPLSLRYDIYNSHSFVLLPLYIDCDIYIYVQIKQHGKSVS